jgi:endonuclease YncB( thermonuclease family)
MLPQMNPLIKGVAELGTNKNFFFDDKIVEDKYYNPDSGEMEAPTFGQRLGKYGEYAMGQIAPLQAGVDMFKKQGIDKGLHMLNTGLGQKFLSYDYETSKDKIIKDYLGTGRKEEELWVDKQLKKLDNLPRNAQGKATKKLVDYVNSTPSSWVAKTVDGTSLEKYLLGNDIATAKVTGVRDGDTIDVKINGKHEAVRFSLIDTPEISHYQGEEAMPFSNEAKALTESLANGKDVRLVISKEKDMHGRLMAYVYVDGQDLNKKLLEDGLASMRYVNLSAQPYNEEEYRQVQNDAYQSGKGLWQLDGYADPEKEGYNKRGAMKRYLELIGGQ